VDRGSGSVTVIGFDPTSAWLAASHDVETLWHRFLPQRTTGGPVVTSDDSQIVSAVSQLASLALPPITGLIAILAGYILLIGPLNYLVLRRLDRRELAWVTMPALIVLFAVIAYGFGTALRGTNVIVNEVAVVRGAPGVTDGEAQVYVGLYSPSRTSYELRFPGAALLSGPISDFSGTGNASVLDLVQSDPALVRNLDVGFSSQRTVRADAPASVPLVNAQLTFKDGLVSGAVTNASSVTLERVAVVLGTSVAVLGDMPAGSQKPVSLHPSGNQFFQSLSDQIFGQVFFGDSSSLSDEGLRQRVRHTVVDQLTFNPQFGSAGPLAASGPVILAWGRDEVLDVQVAGESAQRSANVLYYLPVGIQVSGATTFTSDLISSTVVASDAAFFSKDPFTLNMGAGSATIAYRPIAFSGRIAATAVQFSLNGGVVPSAGAVEIEPLAAPPVTCTDPANTTPAGCVPPRLDGVPEMEVFDVQGGTWKRLPHLGQNASYALKDPARFVDPSTGEVLFRFVNVSADQGVGIQFQVAISGVIS
jgi:hypothetical protein